MTMVAGVRNLLFGLTLIVVAAAGCGGGSEPEPLQQPAVLRKKIAMPKKQPPAAMKPKEDIAVQPKMAPAPEKAGEEEKIPVEKTPEKVSETKPPLQSAKPEAPFVEEKPTTQVAEISPERLAEHVGKEPTYFYDPKGKLDPFQPLFTAIAQQHMAPPKKKGKKEKKLPLTPLQRIDLSQLKLVGIIVSHSGNKALVEEPSGKGYVISKGTYLGTNFGQVAKVLNDRVIVEEEVEDFLSGEMKPQKRELRLQKMPGDV
jgi:type IV pilus assembly protein PilP